MERTLASETPQKIGQEVKLCGWVNTRRDHGKIVFIDLRDRSGVVQVVGGEPLKKLRPEWVVEIKGLVKKRPPQMVNPNLESGKVEVELKEIKVLAEAKELPFDIGSQELKIELPTLLDYRGLTLRHPKIKAIFNVQETIIAAFRESLKKQGFTEIQVPTIVPSITEGGAQVFKISYFKNEAFLAQSPQLYKQIMVGIFERVFTLAHAYRAEPSITTRHLTEYLGLDAEMGFIDSFNEIMMTVETLIRDIFIKVGEKNKNELNLFSATLPKLAKRIPILKMREAQEIIFQRTGKDHRQEPDLDPEDEREICQYAQEKYDSELIFITHYPTKKRPFYTYPDPKDPEYTCSFDLLGRGLEWVTGGQRINDYQTLIEHIKKWGNKPEDFEIYLQAFKYGMPPEGGFCLGAERITMQVLNLGNIREASLFPRDMERIDLRLSEIESKKGQPKSDSAGEEVFEEILKLFKVNKIKYKVFEHDPVLTSEQAAKIRGTKIEQGAKALVMIADNNPIMVVISAAKKVDSEKVKKEFGIKDLRMAKAEEVEQLTGIKIGAVSPFGMIHNLPTFIDISLGKNKTIAFNAGLHTKSVEISYKDYVFLAKPQIGNFAS